MSEGLTSQEVKRLEMIERERERLIRKQKDHENRKLREWLAKGGQRQLRRTQAGELHEVHGPDRERVSAAGYTTIIPPMRDPRIKLTDQQRAAGIFYGACIEASTSDGSASAWVFDKVDSSGGGGLSPVEYRAYAIRVADLADDWLRAQIRVRFDVRATRTEKHVGPHKPVPILDLVRATCVENHNVTTVAVMYGWTTQRRSKMVVSDRQRKRLRKALAAALDGLLDHWHEHGISPPASLHTISSE